MTISVRALPYLAESIADLVEMGLDRIATSVVAEDAWTEADYEAFGEQWLKVAALVLSHRMRGRRLSIKGLATPFRRSFRRDFRHVQLGIVE